MATGIFLFLPRKRQCIKTFVPAKEQHDFLRLQDGMSMVDGELIVTLRGHQIYSNVGILNFHASILANIKSSNLKMKTVAGTFTSADGKKLQTRRDVAPPTL